MRTMHPAFAAPRFNRRLGAPAGRTLALGAILLLFPAGAKAADAPEFGATVKRATGDYAAKLQQAAEELARARERIAGEKAPYLQEMRAAEDRIIAADTELVHLQTGADESAGNKRKLLQDIDAQRKTAAYLSTLSRDALNAVQSGLAAGEGQGMQGRIDALGRGLDDTAAGPNVRAALDVADFLLERTAHRLGGEVVAGEALQAETNQLVRGRFAFVGPETYFLPDGGEAPGVLRLREGSTYPTSHRLKNWKPADATAFFAGQPGTMVADSSNGKALKLEQTSGTLLEHVKKGGVVAYLIIAVGGLALVLVLGKLRDLAQMKVDSRETVQAFLSQLAVRSWGQAESALSTLHATTRELFAEGLRQRHEPKSILEERLQSVLLGQRLHFERRLPLLAVIATAAPLMGLLGTVVGMVKTFTLITVFGTGNAAKLSSGISEVLVATELGLAVAIPSLVVHGFLAHRIHKNLTVLERHALDFLTAAEVAKLEGPASDEDPALVR